MGLGDQGWVTFLDQKLEASSKEKRTPPIGAPNAAAKLYVTGTTEWDEDPSS